MANHEKYQQLTWKEKNERIGKLVHLYQNSEIAFNDMNRLLKAADDINYFEDVEFFSPTPYLEKELNFKDDI